MNDIMELKVVCAWCSTHMRGPIESTALSHGICKVCFEKVVKTL